MTRVLLVISLCASTATFAASAISATDVVPCSAAIDQSTKPDLTGRRIVLGRIVMPRRIVRLDRAVPGFDRFGKAGLDVRAGSPVVLEVPKSWRGVYSLEYAPGRQQVKRVGDGSVGVSVHACAGPLGHWSGYAGGYVVRRPVCVPLIVRADGRSKRVLIALGRSCTRRTGR